MSFLRNPLAWRKRYVEGVYDIPSMPSSIVGRAGHVALQHFYSGTAKELAIEVGLGYLRRFPEEEIEFGRARSKAAVRKKRRSMEEEYLQAVGFYLEKPPRHKVLGVEVVALAKITGLPLPVKAVSDLVVESRTDPKAVDIVDHKFVSHFSFLGPEKPLFILQAIFNYYTVLAEYERPVKRFLLYECKKTKNKRGGPQLKRYVINYDDCKEEFALFHRLIRDASEEITRVRRYLPNPSDMFEGKHSFDIYRLNLGQEEETGEPSELLDSPSSGEGAR